MQTIEVFAIIVQEDTDGEVFSGRSLHGESELESGDWVGEKSVLMGLAHARVIAEDHAKLSFVSRVAAPLRPLFIASTSSPRARTREIKW